MFEEKQRKIWLTVSICFAVLLFIVYASSLQNGFVQWDDGLLIYENAAIWGINLANLQTIFTTYDPELYIPFTLFTYQVDYMLGGTNPTIYHLHNLLHHTINAILVMAFAHLMLKRRLLPAVLCGLFFAIHPLHTEAVAWASARKDVLSTIFFLLTLICYLRYKESNDRRFFKWSLVTYALGLLAKVTVITLPAILLLIDLREKGRWTKRDWLEKIPYWVLSGIFAIIAVGGKTGVLSSSTWTEKILMAPKSFVFYIQKLLMPTGLSVLYPFSGEVTLSRSDILVPLIIFVLLIAIALWSWRRTRELFFAICFFGITISPTLFNFSKGEFFYFASDRYAYIPSIGILLLIAILIDSLFKKHRTVVGTGVALVLLTYAGLTHAQSLTWKDTHSLFQQTLRHYPESVVAHNNIGNYHYRRNEIDAAITKYEEAKELSRREEELSGRKNDKGLSRVLGNLGTAKRKKREFNKAELLYEEALSLNPHNAQALVGQGSLAIEQGNTDEAQRIFFAAIEQHPRYVPAYINLGALYAKHREFERAIAQYDQAIAISPFSHISHFNRGVALDGLNKKRQALDEYKKTVELSPYFIPARANLGIRYLERKKYDLAEEQFAAVLALDPSNEKARIGMQELKKRR